MIRSGQTPATEFSVLGHELGHSLLHQRPTRPSTKTVRELEAEASHSRSAEGSVSKPGQLTLITSGCEPDVVAGILQPAPQIFDPIAALAPKLRLANVLALTWQEHIDPDFRYITVHQHKTSKTLRRPHVVEISEQLRVILRDARQQLAHTSSSTGSGP